VPISYYREKRTASGLAGHAGGGGGLLPISSFVFFFSSAFFFFLPRLSSSFFRNRAHLQNNFKWSYYA
ncbi:MAG: hypothetical protein WBV41_13960, partial [Terriglobales bacterium]